MNVLNLTSFDSREVGWVYAGSEGTGRHPAEAAALVALLLPVLPLHPPPPVTVLARDGGGGCVHIRGRKGR